MKAHITTGVSVAALVLAGALTAAPALAQQAPQADSAAPAPPATAAIQEIVVTAQRHTETVQKSSLAIQVLGGGELAKQGVSQARDLAALVPGLQISLGGNQTQTYIRGVGDFSSTALGQSAVAYNYDGVYIADQASVGPLFYDVSRVEVLKGPQGTLYGRNSSAGAINIITNHPTDTLGGDISMEFGNYSDFRATGAINLPVTSTLAVRAAFNFVSRDGYLSDGSDDDHQQSVRLEALWRPTERLSILVSGDIEHFGGIGPGAVLLPHAPGTGNFTGTVNAADNAQLVAGSGLPPFLLYLPGTGIPGTRTGTNLYNDGFRDNLQRNISAEINYDLGFATATFVPAYRTSNNEYFGYSSGFPFGDNEKTRQQSYELRLTHNRGSLNAVAGLFYLDLHQQVNQFAYISPIPVLTTTVDPTLGTKSYAAFAQASYGLTSNFRVIGGIRYTHEARSIDGDRTSLVTFQSYDDSTNFNSVSFRTGVEYDLAPGHMAYATISRGFKSGGFNTFEPTAGATNIYRPETLYSYTAGVRNRFLDNRLQVNVEGFYWNYINSQQSHLGYDPDGNLQFLTFNAASAKIYGADLDVTYRVTPADTFTGTLEYLHSKFSNFTYQIPTANYSPASSGCVAAVGGTTTTIDCSGRPLPRAPKWSGTGGYQHTFALADGNSVVADVDVNFGSKRYLAVDYTPAELASGYLRENAFLTYNFHGGRYNITAFIKNISDRAVYIGGVNAALSPGMLEAVVDAPRTFGGRFGAKF